ncbi:membrane protein insertion efficiency factor YidD [Corynebacterium pseudopelargi]|uniref:Putative membrane protein insertion efficiency factor n=1 Tax=Corynebacterium pseudopelargi TaxID=2080757 RepID=A0A3G6IXG6_9CORY|nr:membrane protein insertion efficiency factor YidD [Corynebacterium pseudopelargi]AZA10336.1 Putative membrane protein insertion efficiency factor [Corynebacterium pseudopelargi]
MCSQHLKKSNPNLHAKPAGSHRRSGLNAALIAAVRFYQKHLSGLKMGATCRFDPVCSSYALQALEEHGAWRGILLSGARIAKCGPWHPGGYDPVPLKAFGHSIPS